MLSASDFRAAAANNCSLPAPDVARIFLLVVCEIRPRGRPRLSLTNLLRPAPSREFQGPTNHPAARRSVFRPGASSVLASSRMQTRMSPYRISRHISQVSAWESHNSIPQSEHCVLAVFGECRQHPLSFELQRFRSFIGSAPRLSSLHCNFAIAP